ETRLEFSRVLFRAPAPRPRARQPLQGGAARPLCPADRQPAGSPLGGAGGRVRPPLPARGHRPAAVPAVPAEKEHGVPAVLPAGRRSEERRVGEEWRQWWPKSTE